MKSNWLKDIKRPARLESRGLSREARRAAVCLGVFTAFLLAGVAVLESSSQVGSGTKMASAQSPPATVAGSNLLTHAAPPPRFGQAERVQSGWLYVLDNNEMKGESAVRVVDPSQGRVVKSFPAGYYPDMALSPDGRLLYLASTSLAPDGGSGQGRLDIIDTSSGRTTLTVDNPDRWLGTIPPFQSNMALSADGRWLYVFKHRQEDTAEIYHIATFDTRQGKFLPEIAVVTDCVYGAIFPLAGRREVGFVCAETGDVRHFKIEKDGAAESSAKLPLRYYAGARHGQHVGPVSLSSNGRTLSLIMGDGRFFKVDASSRKILRTDGIDGAARRPKDLVESAAKVNADDWLEGRWMRFQSSNLSPDEKRLYMGVGQLGDLRQGIQRFDQVVVLDGQSLSRIAAIETSLPVQSLSLSRDGRHLYAVAAGEPQLLVIDTETNREVRKIGGVGATPSFVIVAP